MKLVGDINTETYDVEGSGGFRVDIVETEDDFEPWLYHKKHRIKERMLGSPKAKASTGKVTTKTDFLNMVRNNLMLVDYVGNYKKEYMK